MQRPVHYVAPGLSLFLIGALLIVTLTAFRPVHSGTETEPAHISTAAGGERRVIIVDHGAALLPELTQRAREIAGVTATVHVKRGTRWLSSWIADGFGAAMPPPGYFVPVDVAAVDANYYREFLPEELKGRADALASGAAILSETSAELRGIPAGGGITFDDGRVVPVAGTVPDDLAREHEIIVSMELGDALGLTQTYLLLALAPDADAAAIEAQIHERVPPGQQVRVRGSAGTGLRPAETLLSMGELKTELGEFSARRAGGRDIEIHQQWIDENTVETTVPILKEQFRCHKEVVGQIAAAMTEIERQGLAHLVDTGDFGGCFNGRFISYGPNSNLSRHSWGAAFDINVQGNLYGHQPTMDLRLVEIIEQFGFSWGGRWDKPDGMHFELVDKLE